MPALNYASYCFHNKICTKWDKNYVKSRLFSQTLSCNLLLFYCRCWLGFHCMCVHSYAARTAGPQFVPRDPHKRGFCRDLKCSCLVKFHLCRDSRREQLQKPYFWEFNLNNQHSFHLFHIEMFPFVSDVKIKAVNLNCLKRRKDRTRVSFVL